MTSAPRIAGRRRGGFTLVELLVAAALCVVIMTVLAVSFRSGMDTLSQMKTVGDLTDKLRAAEVVLQNDLSAYHLEDETGLPVRVSDRTVNRKWDGTNRGWTGAQQKKGFFRVSQGSPPKAVPGASYPVGVPPYPAGLSTGGPTDGYLWEGWLASEGLHYMRANDHRLSFTVRLSGLSDKDAFTVTAPTAVSTDANLRNGLAPADSLSSNWAEVAYFMDRPTSLPATVGGVPLFTLMRRQRVIAQTTPANASTALAPGSVDLSITNTPTAGTLNTPLSITNLANRVPLTRLTGADEGEDVLLSNVVSFQVQVLKNDDVEFTDVPNLTWDSATQPAALTRIRGVQIRLRVYDVRNAVTRQMTIQQDL